LQVASRTPRIPQSGKSGFGGDDHRTCRTFLASCLEREGLDEVPDSSQNSGTLMRVFTGTEQLATALLRYAHEFFESCATIYSIGDADRIHAHLAVLTD
jgi:hypothetical protein